MDLGIGPQACQEVRDGAAEAGEPFAKPLQAAGRRILMWRAGLAGESVRPAVTDRDQTEEVALAQNQDQVGEPRRPAIRHAAPTGDTRIARHRFAHQQTPDGGSDAVGPDHQVIRSATTVRERDQHLVVMLGDGCHRITLTLRDAGGRIAKDPVQARPGDTQAGRDARPQLPQVGRAQRPAGRVQDRPARHPGGRGVESRADAQLPQRPHPVAVQRDRRACCRPVGAGLNELGRETLPVQRDGRRLPGDATAHDEYASHLRHAPSLARPRRLGDRWTT